MKDKRFRLYDVDRFGYYTNMAQPKIFKVLVIDDVLNFVTGIQTTLQTLENVEVITAQDGQTGLDLATSEKPDMIITDIFMPNMGGVQMIELLLDEDDHFSEIPIIVLTNFQLNSELEARVGAYPNIKPMLKVNIELSDIKQQVAEKADAK